MTTFTTHLFGTVHVTHDGAYVPHVAAEHGRTNTPSLFVGTGLDQSLLDAAAALLDADTLDTRSRDAIAEDLERGAEGVVADFVSFHLEELGADTLRAIFGATDVSPSQALAHLERVGVAVHAAPPGCSLVLDYSFGKGHSDQLLAVSFDASGRLIRVSHES